MILFVHMLMGAAIGSLIKNPFLAIILAFLSHYILDLFPHIEYNIENIKKEVWKKAAPDFARVFFDFLLGLILIYLLAGHKILSDPIILTAAFFAVIPDGFTFLAYFLPKNRFLKFHNFLHRKKIHFLKEKKISPFWRILTQIAFALTAAIILNKI